ncbi:MAG: hypothetical protein NXI04_01285 [Planctomycetaceae bacterium]|nr:hypothetical protein [Planctomycetaceae bacterium]
MLSEFAVTASDLVRVNVVGVSGSGKSWFASKLAAVLGTPYLQMDQLYWQPNWTEPAVDEFREIVKQAIDQEAWVLDGNYHSKTKDLKWEVTTLVVWIDQSFVSTMWQAVTRAVHRAWTKQELWPGTGNRESFRRSFFSTESVVLWTLTTYHSARRRYLSVQADADRMPFAFVRLRGRRAVAKFLESARLLHHGQSS